MPPISNQQWAVSLYLGEAAEFVIASPTETRSATLFPLTSHHCPTPFRQNAIVSVTGEIQSRFRRLGPGAMVKRVPRG